MILSCYEAMSGMKINYKKSEIFSVGLFNEEQNVAAELLGCKIRVLPMKYLGMSVSCHNISKAQLSYVCEKTGKRLGT